MQTPKSAPPVPPPPARPATFSATRDAQWLALVRTKVAGLGHGSVQIVVHDGKVTQLEATEKLRLSPPPKSS